jgi:hypothetical protein
MRRLQIFATLALLVGLGSLGLGTATAQADTGVYVTETFSAASYDFGLSAYGTGGLRFTFSVDIRQDARTTSIVGGCLFNETARAEFRQGTYCFAGFDLRHTWQLNKLHPYRASHAGVRLSVDAGPRWFNGNEALTGFSGPGASASVRLEGDAWVIGYFLTAGVDAMAMKIPVDSVVGMSPFLGFGAKFGWL